MNKYLLAAAAVCLTAGISATAYLFASKRGVEDAIRLEDSIIIHGIEMESDTPPSEDGDGQIIYDDSFDDTIIDYDRIAGEKGSRAPAVDGREFARLKQKDPRWHLRRYRIKKNDNLWKIAKRFGVHHRVIIGVNRITNPGMLRPGRYIEVPSKEGIFYHVRKGDSVGKIASRYRIPGKSITAQNGLKGSLIRPGQRLFLPGVVDRSEARSVAIKKRHAQRPAVSMAKFIWPMRGRITSGFGNRRDPFSGQRSFHCGIDISANIGSPVRASADGRVIFSGWKPGYGKVVILRHENGYITVYAHNSRNLVSDDGEVKRGDMIARSGATGAVTGAHLHFEIRKYLNPLNPLRVLR